MSSPDSPKTTRAKQAAGKAAKETRDDVRTTVSFAGVVWQMLEKQMQERGFNNNVSAYLADLVRRDRERSIDLAKAEATYLKPPQTVRSE